jgi:hypothetical protein
MAAVPLCSFCDAELQQTDVKLELPCHRFFHTTCAMNVIHNNWNFFRDHFDECDICQAVFPYDQQHIHMHQNQDAASDHGSVASEQPVRTRIRNLFETNQQFRKKTKDLVKQLRVVKKSRTAVQKLNQAKKGEIRNQLLLLRAQLQGLVETKKGEVQESTEYKDFLKAKRKYTALLNTLYRDYQCSESNVRNYLQDKPGLRRFDGLRRRWGYSRYVILTRTWRWRVPI